MIKKFNFVNLTSVLVILQALLFAGLLCGLIILYFPIGIAITVLIAIYIIQTNRKSDRVATHDYRECLSRALQYTNNPNPMPTLDTAATTIATYLKETVGFSPAISHNATFFPVGEENIARMLYELNNAKHYIFLEFFIIEEGMVWSNIYGILKRKAAEGLDVRLICDGAGCMHTLPNKFIKTLECEGIKVRLYNPIRPILSSRNNIRNHRKLAITDGKVAFCCGLNLADQYANIKEMYGHFKDSAIEVDGNCAWNMTLMFLSMWEFVGKSRVDYSKFRVATSSLTEGTPPCRDSTQCVPMADIPTDDVTVSENTLINFISTANTHIYITTPYFMCGKRLLTALYTAASERNTDVRIITPFAADKKLVKAVTESYYRQLINNKVRVFEYLPGFIHAKNLIADGKRAMVGTVNLDYRSLYSDYECGVCLFGGKVVDDIADDFAKTFAQCREITIDDLNKVNVFKRVIQRLCRVFQLFL